ncbi:hypothetical protein KUV85_15120 [Nocardioides panacisoli]|uniref:hypothetical protein n=1 Tax=Nocardioides panacisoli TaxID=627624 RepID=UPI001C639114|nr:hypothetical protein [Nocardioides panacisoli]QYJ03647.1 hypothetical protein KUV85_15120 [Nocardioides panacisoli]
MEETPASRAEYVVGLVADPGVPHRIARWLAEEDRLAARLAEGTDDHWRVEVVEQQLHLDADGTLPAAELGRHALAEHDWDAVVLVTDLPRRAEWLPILADYTTDDCIAMLSVPALGALRTRRRALRATAHVVSEHVNPRRTQQQRAGDEDDREQSGPGHPTDEQSRRARGMRAPLGHVESSYEGIDEHIALLGVRGRLRLLAGMVRANRPWLLLPSLSPAIAGAAAGAAFGVFYSNIWKLADAFAPWRLVLVTGVAVGAMIIWLIADNGLWERRRDLGSREAAVIANTATTATISVAVLFMYLLLFVATLFAAFVVIPHGHMESQVGHAVGLADYVGLAWLSTSMGTIAGALGSGLADEEAVKQAAYSRREYQRRQQREENDRGTDHGDR